MPVPLYEFVFCQECGILFSSRGHNDLITWITVKWLR